jgi:hypothetical protein
MGPIRKGPAGTTMMLPGLWNEMINVQQKAPLSVIVSKFNLTRYMHNPRSNEIYLYSEDTNINLDLVLR